MLIERNKIVNFEPIVITLETEEELKALFSMANWINTSFPDVGVGTFSKRRFEELQNDFYVLLRDYIDQDFLEES